jgi:tRNA pseudouridine38-40 synthase
MRVLLTLQYLGTRYAGWQCQENALAIQEVVEKALAKIFGVPVRIHGAGRTDTGVHALAQRAHFDLPSPIPLAGLVRGLNTTLPPDIRATGAEEVPQDFHARMSAVGKTYRYQIWNAEIADVFLAPTWAHVAQPLDTDRMAETAAALVGTHDFRSFTVADPEVSTTVRRVDRLSVARHGDRVIIEAQGDGFLRNMVRRIAGHLIEVGRGKLDVQSIRRALEPEFAESRWTAPAEGLVLVDVEYRELGTKPEARTEDKPEARSQKPEEKAKAEARKRKPEEKSKAKSSSEGAPRGR